MRSEADSQLELVDLMQRYQNGEIAAFDGLYERLGPMLRRYLLSLTLNVHRAEDLLQEAFLQLHRSRHTYVPPRPVRPWAFGIARNVFLMERRYRTHRERMERPRDDALPDPWTPDASLDVERRDLLRRAMTDLPHDRREPLLLHHVWGMSFKEIAGVLGIRPGTAKVRAHRGIAQLRESMGVKRG